MNGEHGDLNRAYIRILVEHTLTQDQRDLVDYQYAERRDLPWLLGFEKHLARQARHAN